MNPFEKIKDLKDLKNNKTALYIIGGVLVAIIVAVVLIVFSGNDEPEFNPFAQSEGVVTGTEGDTSDSASAETDDEDYSWLSERYATNEDIKGCDSHQIRILRNSIFARHGRKFKDPSLREYFSSKSWYKPSRDEVPPKELNKYETANIQFLKKHE